MVVEAGVSVDAAGRRFTGVVPGERDRGRPDAVRDGLAVGLAGTLVRGRAWNALSGFGTPPAADVECGWRACAAGLRVVVVPSAVVSATRPAPHQAGSDRAFRVGALRLRLGFAALWALPAVWLGVVLGGGVRAAGQLGRGRPGQAADEVRSAFEAALRP
nr:hypothetical protein [Micromonospora sp. DSM 115978]